MLNGSKIDPALTASHFLCVVWQNQQEFLTDIIVVEVKEGDKSDSQISVD